LRAQLRGVDAVRVKEYINGTLTEIGALYPYARLFGRATDPWTDRAYTVDYAGTVRTWNIGVPSVNGQFTEQGMPLVVSGLDTTHSGYDVFAATRSLDGHTGFIAGRFGIAVLPEF